MEQPTQAVATSAQPPVPSAPPANVGGVGTAATAARQAAQQPAPPPAQTAAPAEPKVMQPVRRSGLAGIVDEIRDALAGTTHSKIYTDQDGNKYVRDEQMTHGQQWLKIASEAIHGAAAGLANGQGPGGKAKAFAAGVGEGERMADKEQQQRKAQKAEVKQDQLDKFNMIKLKHDVAAGEFALTRMKTKGTQEDVQFAQGQIDREHSLGSADLGTYADPAALAEVKKQNPEFWKDVYANNIVTLPEFGADGERKGIRVFLRTKGVGNELVPKGTQVLDFVPGSKPGEQPKLVPRTLTMPATHDQVDTWNNAAQSKYSKWATDQQKLKDDEAQRLLREEQTRTQKTEQDKNRATAAKEWAEARRVKMESLNGGDDIHSQAEALVDGRNAISLLSKRSKDFNAILAQADKISMDRFGKPYDRNQGEIRYQQFKHTMEYYSPEGQGGKTLASFDKFLGHAMEASEAVNELRNTDTPLVNTGLNKLSLLTGNKRTPQVARAVAALETVKREYETSLKNNAALTDDDRKAGDKLLSENVTPATGQEVLKQMAHISSVRLRAEDFSFSRIAHTHLPDLVSPEGSRALQHFGIDPNAVYSHNAEQHTNTTAQPQQSQFQAYSSDGKWGWDGKAWVSTGK